MFHIPQYYNDLSLRLSEVLDDIGVTENMVLKRRRATLLQETLTTITCGTVHGQSCYQFGSQSEGTTTIGLKSDVDTLYCNHELNVIQDYDEWKQGYLNLLMIQDDNTAPGYCLLQLIRPDLHRPVTDVANEHCVKVNRDRVLLKNTFFKISVQGRVKHGPSWSTQGEPGIRDNDFVPAVKCKSWPYEARAWLHRQGLGRWPTPDIKRFAESSGCFVVAVGSKVSHNEALEWRISTSLTERCLMFSLNITQIRCYVLMKMILKTFLNPQGEGHLSSFMCKTVMLHCIENTHSSLWVEHNLLTCLSQCLHVIFTCLLQGNCPHFIIPGNNLMAGQFSAEVKHKLLENMCYIMQTNGLALLGIQTDDLGHRLQIRLNMIHHTQQAIHPSRDICLAITAGLLHSLTRELNYCYERVLDNLTDATRETTYKDLLIFLHRTYVIASSNIQTNNTVSQEALDWLDLGLNSDVLSGRLKLATVLYCMGHMVSTEVVLKDARRRYNWPAVESICTCYNFPHPTLKKEFSKAVNNNNTERAIRANTAFCIRFSRADVQCVPHELQFEMFRSTQDDLLHRKKDVDNWMDRAVVDSLPYLYFLQYKTYGQLQRNADQQQALTNLIETIEIERNLGHRETALNLLGQCMEQENQVQNALTCYTRSLNIRDRNNAAGVHICKLLASMYTV